MSRSAPAGLAKFDSAAAMVLALSRFLHGQDFPALGQSRWLQYPVAAANLIPRGARERLFAFMGGSEGVSPGKAGMVSAAGIAEWMVGLYPQRRYPAIMIGSSNGALVHIGAALGIPWLPQTFLVLIKQTGVHPDDAVQALEAAREPASRFLAANPDVQLHHMHDPSQDRLMLDYITYFRPKLLRLPIAYREFITRFLEPGGAIILIECERRWPTTRVDARYVFQFGAIGGPTTEEYFHGSARVEEYLARYGSPRRRWEPPPTDGESPEAEWGFEPALREDVTALARERGYRLLRLIFEHPESPSAAVADFYRTCYREGGLLANRLLIESFIVLEPYLTLRIGAVPFWMSFNMQPSLNSVQNYLDGAEPFDHIHLMLFAHGVNSVGLPPIEQWRGVLNRADKSGSFLGVDDDAYPAHFAAFTRYHMDMRKIPARHPLPGPLPLKTFEHFVEKGGARYPLCLLSADVP